MFLFIYQLQRRCWLLGKIKLIAITSSRSVITALGCLPLKQKFASWSYAHSHQACLSNSKKTQPKITVEFELIIPYLLAMLELITTRVVLYHWSHLIDFFRTKNNRIVFPLSSPLISKQRHLNIACLSKRCQMRSLLSFTSIARSAVPISRLSWYLWN